MENHQNAEDKPDKLQPIEKKDSEKGWWALIKTNAHRIVSILTIVVGLSAYVTLYIDNRITSPEFVRQVANQVGKQTILLDEKGIVIDGFYPTANAFLEDEPKIKFDNKNRIKTLTLNLKDIVPVAPMVEALNADYMFSEGVKINSKTYQYERIEPISSFKDRWEAAKKPKTKIRIMVITP